MGEVASSILARIEAAVEAREARSVPRSHMGPSALRSDCDRRLWHQARGIGRESFDGRMLRLFQRGHDEEPRIAAWLELAGFEARLTAPSGRQWGFSFYGGLLAGSCDGFALIDGEWVMIEIKTHSAKSFGALRAKGVAGAKPEHVAQVQVYLEVIEGPAPVARCLYIAINKDTDALHMEWIDACQTAAHRSLDRLHAAVFAERQPLKITENPASYLCRYCASADICHRAADPGVTCRTCAHASPTEDRGWVCGLGRDFGTPCAAHLYHPDLVPLRVASATMEAITYEGGTINGVGGVASVDLFDLIDQK